VGAVRRVGTGGEAAEPLFSGSRLDGDENWATAAELANEGFGGAGVGTEAACDIGGGVGEGVCWIDGGVEVAFGIIGGVGVAFGIGGGLVTAGVVETGVGRGGNGLTTGVEVIGAGVGEAASTLARRAAIISANDGPPVPVPAPAPAPAAGGFGVF